MSYKVHDQTTAPEAVRPLLEQAEKAYGFVPNILGIMASSPPLLEAYMTVSAIFEKTGFSPTEQQVVLLAVSAENECGYCTRAHAAIARMQKVDEAIVKAIQNGDSLPEKRLDVLYRFTRHMVASRGRPDESELETFHEADYGPEQIQDVVLGIGLKTLSNYNNHIAETPVDDAF